MPTTEKRESKTQKKTLFEPNVERWIFDFMTLCFAKRRRKQDKRL